MKLAPVHVVEGVVHPDPLPQYLRSGGVYPIWGEPIVSKAGLTCHYQVLEAAKHRQVRGILDGGLV